MRQRVGLHQWRIFNFCFADPHSEFLAENEVERDRHRRGERQREILGRKDTSTCRLNWVEAISTCCCPFLSHLKNTRTADRYHRISFQNVYSNCISSFAISSDSCFVSVWESEWLVYVSRYVQVVTHFGGIVNWILYIFVTIFFVIIAQRETLAKVFYFLLYTIMLFHLNCFGSSFYFVHSFILSSAGSSHHLHFRSVSPVAILCVSVRCADILNGFRDKHWNYFISTLVISTFFFSVSVSVECRFSNVFRLPVVTECINLRPNDTKLVIAILFYYFATLLLRIHSSDFSCFMSAHSNFAYFSLFSTKYGRKLFFILRMHGLEWYSIRTHSSHANWWMLHQLNPIALS